MTPKQKTDGRPGALAPMVPKTLDVLGPIRVYGIARSIKQFSLRLIAVNQGVLVFSSEQRANSSYGCASKNNRRARLTREGRKPLQVQTHDCEQTAAIIARFFKAKAEDWT